MKRPTLREISSQLIAEYESRPAGSLDAHDWIHDALTNSMTYLIVNDLASANGANPADYFDSISMTFFNSIKKG